MKEFRILPRFSTIKNGAAAALAFLRAVPSTARSALVTLREIVRKRPILLAIPVGLIALVVLVIVVIVPHGPALAFYRVPENIREAILEEARTSTIKEVDAFTVVALDDTLPLGPQLRKKGWIDILFIEDGYAARQMADRAASPSVSALKLMTSAFRRSGSDGKKSYGLPLVADHFSFAVSRPIFAELGLQTPNDITGMVQTAARLRRPGRWPIICAGANDRDLFLLIGSLAEARFGEKGWSELASSIEKETDFRKTLDSTCLRKILEELISWRREKLLHPEWFRMTSADLEGFMGGGLAGMAILPLSTRRTLPLDVVDDFENAPFPGGTQAETRLVTAPMYLGMALDSGLGNGKAKAFLASLLDSRPQARISGSTGLAPANAMAEAVDAQSSDVRYWIASSKRAIPDPVAMAMDDPSRMAAFARELRLFIESGGVGY